jgi:cell division protein FtsL
MNIRYFEPLNRAWNRMKIALFRPFDINKWFVVGFNAFLAGLAEGHHGSGSSRWHGRFSFREFFNLPNKIWDWLMTHPGWFIAIIFIALFVIAIGIILLWLSSRGKFMFLDNVVYNRAEIAKPWRQFRMEGNSLFLWRLIFSLICLILFITLAVFFFMAGSALYQDSYHSPGPLAFTVGMGLLFLLMVIVIGYISLFLNDFVVPIMSKNNITATQAWGRFLPLLGRHLFYFIFYGLLIFVLMIMFVIFVIAAGLVTCCIGWLVLVIPYIGTVVTLPFWYALRAFSLEFLAQFGPEYELFPPSVSSPGEAQV